MAKKNDISIDIYHRIYRLAVRKVPAEQIAFTLNLPISVIKSIVEQFFPASKNLQPQQADTHEAEKNQPDQQSYLDIYILQRLRFTIIDLNGMVIEKHHIQLKEEVEKALNSNIKIVAILMKNVKKIDEIGLTIIISLYNDFINRGRYLAILDPSKEIEPFLEFKEIEKVIPVFGTEKAFEERALHIKNKNN